MGADARCARCRDGREKDRAMTLLVGLTLLCSLSAALLALRLYCLYGRRGAWVLVCAAALLYSLHGILDTLRAPDAHGGGQAALALLLPSACLVAGLLMMDGVFRTMAGAQEGLTREKRRLSMLVDRRVADLELEVSERTRAEAALHRDRERFASIISMQYDIATAELDLNAVMELIVARAQELTRASGALIETGGRGRNGVPGCQRTRGSRAWPAEPVRRQFVAGVRAKRAHSALQRRRARRPR